MEGVVNSVNCFGGTYAGRRVFVTGHTGFKGAWLTLWLHRLGARVTGYALTPPTSPSLYELARVHELCDSHISDIRDRDALRGAIARAQPDLVFHLAAQPLVRRSYVDPIETFETNIMGTVNLLEAVRDCPSVSAVQVITTDKCYENREWTFAYRENDALGGHDPYSASKAAAEIVTSAYERSFFGVGNGSSRRVSVCSVRAGNVVGGGDYADARIIPDCIRAFAHNEPVALRYPNATRPWQYVLDCLGGYLHLARRQMESADLRGAWNFGPGPEPDTRVSRVVEEVIRSWGTGTWTDGSIPKQPHEANSLRLDCTKSATLLGWRPTLDVFESVEESVRWYRDVHDNHDPRKTSEDTLERYLGQAAERRTVWTS